MTLAKLIDDNVAMLEDAVGLIEQLIQRAEGDGTVGYANGVGPHLRHILDHFDRFFTGLDTGLIDYDDRARCQQTELSPGFGQRRLCVRLRKGHPEAASETAGSARDGRGQR